MTQEIPRLPGYPTTQDREALSASQVASLNQNVATAISIILALPADKRDTAATRNFLTAYAKDIAFQTLQNLIWRDSSKKTPDQSTGNEKLVHQRSLLLVERLASSSTEIGIELLLDLAVIYARLRSSRIQSIFLAAFKSSASALTEAVSLDLVPGFTALLLQQCASQGLYAMRKVAECIFAFLRASGGTKGIPELVRPFAYSKPFILALASFYDSGLSAIASSYGSLSALTTGMSNQGREPDEWEIIWVETKVTLLDTFHIIVATLLEDLASCPSGSRLAVEAERTFDIIFALLQVPSSSSTTMSSNNTEIPPTPFLNRPLLADYQESYSLSKALAKALCHSQEKDVRLDLLENTLQSFNTQVENRDPDHAKERNSGALKILLRSSGIQTGIDNRGSRKHPAAPSAATTNTALSTQNTSALNSSSNQLIPRLDWKGKAKARLSDPLDDINLDLKTIQVLDILPDLSSTYVRLLLTHDRYCGDAEKVVAALLEGAALSEEDLEHDLHGLEDGEEYTFGDVNNPQDYSLNQRRNVFDEEVLDIDLFRTGKKTTGEDILRDKTFIEEMKDDILRRAEAIEDDDEDEQSDVYIQGPISANASNKGKSKNIEFPDDDDDDTGLVSNVRILGDGEESDVDNDEEDEEQVKAPETMLELAYLRDPKVFDRDAVTRRSKARTDLKTQTGWADEQIEGWRVMLERNPGQKKKMLQKHAFSGNEKGLEVHPSGGNRGRGRGRPRGGRGRGGGAGAEEDVARAWKDKNKATQGNHNRKRGHDKKMARVMGGPGPST